MENSIQLSLPANRHILNKIFAHTNYSVKVLKQYWALRTLHWGTASAILVGVGSLIVGEYVAEYSYRTGLLELAFQIGVLVIMGFVVVRISSAGSALIYIYVF